MLVINVKEVTLHGVVKFNSLFRSHSKDRIMISNIQFWSEKVPEQSDSEFDFISLNASSQSSRIWERMHSISKPFPPEHIERGSQSTPLQSEYKF